MISLLTIFKPIEPIQVSSSVSWYGRVFEENVYLYRTPSDKLDNVYFIIEPSYFVELLDNANSVFYKAKYMDIVGYIKKNEVQVTDSKPKTPFLDNVKFRIYLDISQSMYDTPNNINSSFVAQLPIYYKNATYYGKVYGKSLIEDRTNVWYYCKYTTGKTYYGYIYSDGTDQMTNIYKNTEQCNYVEEPNFHPTPDLSIIEPQSNDYKIVVILICVPVAIFVFMIIKSGFILRLNKKEKVKEVTNFFDS